MFKQMCGSMFENIDSIHEKAMYLVNIENGKVLLLETKVNENE